MPTLNELHSWWHGKILKEAHFLLHILLFWKLNKNGLKSSSFLKHTAVFLPWTPTGSNKMAAIQGKGKLLLKALQGST